MPRKTAIYGFNLFYHDESVLSAEDIRPGETFSGPLQADPTNTLNYNFKRMEDIIRSITEGTINIESLHVNQDLQAGRDVIVGRHLILNPAYGLVLKRDHRPSPHVLLDFADALVHAGINPDISVTLSTNGNVQTDNNRLNPFKPDNSGRSFIGNNVYPVVYTISTSTFLFDVSLVNSARLFLAFSAIPQGLSAVKLEASYDGTTYVVLGYYTSGLNQQSFLFDSATFSDPPLAIRVTLEGTNSVGTNFSLTRLALIHAGTPALEGFYLSKAGGAVFGNIELLNGGVLIGPVQGNADTASQLATARAINLSGAVSGTANFNGSSDITITTSLNNNTVNTANIADGAITLAKISSSILGQPNGLAYLDANGAFSANDAYLNRGTFNFDDEDWNTLTTTGVYKTVNSGSGGSNQPPTANKAGFLMVFRGAGASCVQMYVPTSNDAFMYIRTLQSTWSSWRRYGAVYGSNTNGSYVRLPDGTQICWGSTAGSAQTETWNYPAEFTAAPVVTIGVQKNSSDSPVVVNFDDAPSSTSVTVKKWYWNGLTFVSTTNEPVKLTAIGRWY
jgi:hypothetical protein